MPGRFQIKRYNKKDSFNFNIIRMPYKSSNISHKIFYVIMSAKILQICKTTSKFQDFTKSTEILIERIIKQTGLINHMKKALLRLFNSHEEYSSKFRKNNNYILNTLLHVCKL